MEVQLQKSACESSETNSSLCATVLLWYIMVLSSRLGLYLDPFVPVITILE